MQLWRHEVSVLCPPAVIDARFDMGVDNVWRDAPDFDQAIVLDEYRLAGEIAVNDWRLRIV